MVNDELRAYVKNCLATGHEEESLKLALLGSGWDPADVDAVFHEIASPATTPPPLVEETPQPVIPGVSAIPPSLGTTVNNVSIPTIPTYSAYASPDAPTREGATPDNGVLSVMPSVAPLSVVATAPEIGKKRLLFIAVGIATFLFASFGAVYAYMSFAKPDPNQLLKESMGKFLSADSYHMNSTTTFKLSGTMSPQGETGLSANGGVTGELSLTVRSDGAFQLGATPEGATGKNSTSYDIALGYGPMNMKFDGAIETQWKDKVFYLNIMKMPKVPFMDLTPYQNKWIRFDPKTATKELMDEAGKEFGASLADASGTLPELTEEKRQEIANILETNWPYITEYADSAASKELGVPTWHLRAQINKEKARALILEIAQLDERVNKEVKPEEIDQAMLVVEKITFDVYVAKDDRLPRYIEIVLPAYSTTTNIMGTAAALTASFALTADFTDFGKPVTVSPPEKAINIEDLLRQTKSKNSVAGNDSVRISDIANYRLALELYFDAHGKYPESLELLLKEHFIAQMSVDPRDHMPYVYKQLDRGKSYVLGASLEDPSNKALLNDADIAPFLLSSRQSMSGSDAKGCKGEPNRACYDVTP